MRPGMVAAPLKGQASACLGIFWRTVTVSNLRDMSCFASDASRALPSTTIIYAVPIHSIRAVVLCTRPYLCLRDSTPSAASGDGGDPISSEGLQSGLRLTRGRHDKRHAARRV